MKCFINKCLLICSTTLFVCFTLACPQAFQRGYNQDYNQDYDDWERVPNSRNNYPSMNRINDNQLRNRGRYMDDFRPYESAPMHQIEDRSYDLAYGLGRGYGRKLGDGIKSGIGKSINLGFNRGSNADKEKDDSNKKREEP